MPLATASDEGKARSRTYAKVRAPRCHGAAVVHPHLGAAGSLVERNRSSKNAWELNVAGEPIVDLAGEARQHLVNAAIAYTGRYRDTQFAAQNMSDGPLVLSGHQPELFHAGVWFKNFALGRTARELHGLGIHLLIDNDLLRQRSLHAPAGIPDQATSTRIAFDDVTAPAVPYEEATVKNAPLFCSFADRLADTIAPFVDGPTILTIWPHAVNAIERGANVGSALSQARHLLEQEWGLETLELPLSAVCESRVFRIFAAHVVEQLPRYHTVYNRSLEEYRRDNHIRSHSHPAPALGKNDAGWLEAPFWVWDGTHPQREPVFAMVVNNCVRMKRGRQGAEFATWPMGDPRAAETTLATLKQHGMKLRPRALMTTMYARMLLSDLFLHGIGGGKYDQLTDKLITEFWGVEPPEFMVASATMRLPSSRLLVEPDDVRQIDGLLRQLEFHPDQMDPPLSDRSEFVDLCRRKRQLLAVRPEMGSRKSWHDQLELVNGQLRALFKSKQENLLREKSRLSAQSRHDQHLASREYSFSILPESRQKKTLLDLVATIA